MNQMTRAKYGGFAVAVAAVVLSIANQRARAASVYWDPSNGAAAETGSSTPSGNWGTSGANTSSWGNSAGTAAPAAWVDASGDTAVFSAGTDATGTYTVTLTTPVTLAGIMREEGSPTISGSSNVMTFTGGNLAVDTGSGSLTVNALYAPSNGVITKTGSGVFTSGTSQSSFAGKWVADAGTLTFPGDTRVGVVPAAPVPDEITLNSGARIRSNLVTIVFDARRGITLGPGGGGFDHNASVTLTWNGPITGSSGGDLNMSGAGNLILTNTANNYNGNTVITAGKLTLGASGVIPDTSVLSTAAGSTFDLNGFNETVKSISGSPAAAGTIALGANTLTISNPSGETFGDGTSGSITGSTGGKLVKNGAGALILAPSSANYSGGLTLNNGTLGVGSASSFGTGTFTYNGGTLSNNSASVRTVPASVAVGINADMTVDDSLAGGNAGQILFNGGGVTLKNGNRTITVNATANLGFAGAVGEDVAGRSLTKAGSGTLALTGASTYSGSTSVTGGTLLLNHAGGNAISSTVVNINGGTLLLSQSDQIPDSASLSVNGASAVLDLGANHAETVNSVTLDGGGSITGTGTSALTTATTFAVKSGSAGAILAGNGKLLSKTTSGTVTLTGANTYTGGTNVAAGTLVVNRLHENNPVTITGGTLKVAHSIPLGSDPNSGNDAFVSRPGSMPNITGGLLDLTNNDLVIDYSNPLASPAASVETLVRSGFGPNQDWLGTTGISSSTATDDSNYMLAVAENADLSAPFGDGGISGPKFYGQSVDDTTVLVKFTWHSDIDLDGLVTSTDAVIFSTNYQEGAAARWMFGDQDYDGVYSSTDAVIFATNYNEALTSLPEPGCVGLIAAVAAVSSRGAWRRRRRERTASR